MSTLVYFSVSTCLLLLSTAIIIQSQRIEDLNERLKKLSKNDNRNKRRYVRWIKR